MNPRSLLPLLMALAGAAQAQNFVLESAVIDSRSGSNLGVSTERGEVASLFRAQKALTFGILRSAGIDLNALPPDVRARIERFQTTSLEAFRAYSNGLDLKDQGRFAEAREQFRRAAELDPNFGLATEQQQAMPEVTLNTAVQLRAALATSAGQAVSRGQATYAVDAQRAIAAAQGGLAVAQARPAPPTDAAILEKGYQDEYAEAGTGAGTDGLRNLGTAVAFGIAPDFRLALSSEWKGSQYRVEGGQLLAAGGSDQGVLLQRSGAVAEPGGSLDLADGSRVYWGRWMSSASGSANVVLGATRIDPALLGPVDWIAGETTRALPGITATFTPAGGGNLSNVSGSIVVDFQGRDVTVNNLGFTLEGLVFSGLQGSGKIREFSPSGLFSGSYTAGSCAGCNGFVPGSSSYSGNFLGRNADGMLFSTQLSTQDGLKAGITVLKKEP